MKNNVFLILRVLLGGLFIVSGLEKAMSPSANFLYVIQAYQILPDALARIASEVFPWVELLTGLFILLGLWLDWALKLLVLISASLMVMVSQAIVRHLPIDDCGCFGNLVHLPLHGVIFIDMTVLVCSLVCLRNLAKTRRMSLDALYDSRES